MWGRAPSPVHAAQAYRAAAVSASSSVTDREGHEFIRAASRSIVEERRFSAA